MNGEDIEAGRAGTLGYRGKSSGNNRRDQDGGQEDGRQRRTLELSRKTASGIISVLSIRRPQHTDNRARDDYLMLRRMIEEVIQESGWWKIRSIAESGDVLVRIKDEPQAVPSPSPRECVSPSGRSPPSIFRAHWGPALSP